MIVTGSGPGVLRRGRPGGRRRHLRQGRERRRRPTPACPATAAGMVTLRIFESHKPVIAAINGAGGRRRRHDDAADGHPARQHDGPVRVRVRPPRHRARGGVELVPAARRRHQPGARVVLLAAGCSRPTRRSPAGWCAASTRPTSCCRRPARSPARSRDNAAPVSVALTRQMMWRMLGADHPMEAHRVDSRAILQRGRSDDAREGVTSFLEKRAAGVHRSGQRRAPRRVPGMGRARVRLMRPPGTPAG